MKYTIFVLLKTFKTIYFNLFRLQNKIMLTKLLKNWMIQILAVGLTGHS